ncbi:MAG: glycosyltransferase [Thiobacillaceae bacterium]
MWKVISPHEGLYQDIVDSLVSHGARVRSIGESSKAKGTIGFSGKLGALRVMLNPKLFGLRSEWESADNVLVIGWLLLPILFLIKLRWLHRPKYLVSLGCFVHSQNVRQVRNALLRMFKFPGLRFVAFSQKEVRALVAAASIPNSSVHFHLWRQDLNGRAGPEDIKEGDYIFSGGYSNRDYELLISALKEIQISAVIVASKMNSIPDVSGTAIRILRDLDEAEFEKLLARSRLVVLPLKYAGEACGQSVLLRVLRNHKPLIVSQHESVESYLGRDYPGFVQPGNVDTLAAAIRKALSDQAFLELLRTRVTQAQVKLSAIPHPGDEIYAWLSGLN